MRTLVVAAALALTFVAGGASAKDFKIDAKTVKNACGSGLQGGGKNFGCTKCDGGLCRDFSCNGSGKGRQGCWERVIKRTGPQTSKHDLRPSRSGNAVDATSQPAPGRLKPYHGAVERLNTQAQRERSNETKMSPGANGPRRR